MIHYGEVIPDKTVMHESDNLQDESQPGRTKMINHKKVMVPDTKVTYPSKKGSCFKIDDRQNKGTYHKLDSDKKS